MKPSDECRVKNIPIDKIRIINPRERDRKKHQQLIDSIAALGLKCPIRVSLRRECNEDGYDLVFGQGRLEAYVALGAKEIPAIVVDVPREERLLMSLVENIARRHPSPAALIREIERLKKLRYTNAQIAEKIGISDTTIGGLLLLAQSREERLLTAALRGTIPITVAIDIVKTENIDTQRELLKAYESKQLNGISLRVVKSLIERRNLFGKAFENGSRENGARSPSADSLVVAYRKKMDRQKNVVQKANATEARLLFVVTALRKLFDDKNYVNLLRAEGLGSLPEYLAERVKRSNRNESAAA